MQNKCDDLKQHFMSIFGCKSTLDCDVFAGIDSEEHILETYRHIAKARGSYPPPGAKKEDFDVPSMLPPHQRKRYYQLSKQYALTQADKNRTEK